MSKKPMYEQMKEELKRKIMDGFFSEDEPLPTQIELAEMFNTSEITSRRALAELVNEGLIYRIRGKGTFIKGANSNANVEKLVSSLKRIYFVYPKSSIEAFNHPFFEELLSGIYNQCQLYGIEFLLWSYDESKDIPKGKENGFIILTQMLGNAEGWIFTKSLEQWKREDRRMITVHFYYPHLQIPYIVGDNMTGGFLATQHLLSLGHERIGIIVTGKSLLDINQEFSLRLEGYKLALSQYQIKFNPAYVHVADGDQEREEMGYRGMKYLLSLNEPPTAVFATSDYKAIGCYRAIREQGLQVPKDISVVGYDNLSFTQYVSPQLTTIHQRSEELGKQAVELLVEKWEKKEPNDLLKGEIIPELIVRNSTASPLRTESLDLNISKI